MILLPTPRQIITREGTCSLTSTKLIVLNSPAPQTLQFAVNRLKKALRTHADVTWSVVAGNAFPAERIGLTINILPTGTYHPQGYDLTIKPNLLEICASTPVGATYAIFTLIQLLEQYQADLPQLVIADWPDFDNRGMMLDVSRDKIMSMETMYELIDTFASWKINQIQLYTEHTFAYQNHPDVWAEASPLTGEEILALDAFCRERFIELVPNQNTFGHMRRWLTHDRYRPLSECPEGCDTGDPEWGYFDEPFTLCPDDPGSLDLIRSLMDELLPHFSSHQFNVGCDETVDLGKGRSSAIVNEKGKGRVYFDFLLKIYREVKARGYTMQFWGDIIMVHPELASELPRDTIAMEWGYEAHHPFAEHGAQFAASGIPFYVCAGTSAWNSVAGRTDNAIKNLQSAARNGLNHGAIGYLITDWGDNGYWQPLPVSYLGFAYGAALAWAYQANEPLDVPHALNQFVFHDHAGKLGQLAYELGNTYLELGHDTLHNNSVLFRILQDDPQKVRTYEGVTVPSLQARLAYIDTVMQQLDHTDPQRPDADLIKQEFTWVANILRHACRRGLWILGEAIDPADLRRDIEPLIAEYHALWHARNRSGGFKDSVALFEKMKQSYL